MWLKLSDSCIAILGLDKLTPNLRPTNIKLIDIRYISRIYPVVYWFMSGIFKHTAYLQLNFLNTTGRTLVPHELFIALYCLFPKILFYGNS